MKNGEVKRVGLGSQIGRYAEAKLVDDRLVHGVLMSYDPDLDLVMLSREENQVIFTSSFPASMIQNIQTR